MSAQRRRPILYAIVGLVAVWLLATAGWIISDRAKVTADKVAVYLHDRDLAQLSAEARARALRELAAKMNALTVEERRKARLQGEWNRWFREMTEEEKGAFIEATMPSGFQQMLAAFEKLPADQRQRAINDAMKEMKKARDSMEGGEAGASTRANRPPEMSEGLQQKVVTIGLKSFYSQSSAQTKAELAPLLEEMQRSMESGKLFRGGRR